MRDLKYLKEKELIFFFMLDQKFKQISGNKTVDEQVTHVSNIIMVCINLTQENKFLRSKPKNIWKNNEKLK